MTWAIYWVSCLDGLKMILGFFAAILCCTSAFMFGVSLFEGAPAILRKAFKWCFVIGLACAMVNCFTPSSRSAAAMVALPAMVNGEAARLPPELTALAQDWAQELQEEKKHGKR